MDTQEKNLENRDSENSTAVQYKKMTETPIGKLVIQLGIPTTISMLVTSVYNMADTYFVSEEGNSASGAIGVVFGLMAVIQAFGFMFGQGAGSVASRALGAKDKEKATRFASSGFFGAVFVGLLIGIFGLIFIDPFMRLLGSSETILPYAREYGRFILYSAPFMCSSCVLNNVLRFEGKAALAMIGLASGGILNIFGDWILIEGFGMGVTGAGISTAISQTVSFCLLLSIFLLGKTESKIRFTKISRDIKEHVVVWTTGFPSLVRQGLTSISTMLLNGYAKEFGDAAVAAMSIVNRVCFFTFATALGIGQGFQPVCAFNYGAQKYKRVRKAFLYTFVIGEILLGTVAIVGLIVADNVVALFRDDPEVIAIGTTALAAQFVGQFFQPLAVCSNMMFQSVGKRFIATVLSMLRSGLFFIPLIIVLTNLFGLPGIQYSQAVSDILTFFAAAPFAIKFLKELKIKEAHA